MKPGKKISSHWERPQKGRPESWKMPEFKGVQAKETDKTKSKEVNQDSVYTCEKGRLFQ